MSEFENTTIQYLLQNQEIRDQFEEILNFLAKSENPEFTEIKNKVVEISNRLTELGEKKKEAKKISPKEKKEAKAARKECRQDLFNNLNKIKPQLEKLAAEKRLDSNSTVEEFLQSQNVLKKNPAETQAWLAERKHWESSENAFSIVLQNQKNYRSVRIDVKIEKENPENLSTLKKILEKKYEINFFDFVLQTTKKIITGKNREDRENHEIVFDLKKVNLYFEELEKRKQRLHEKPNCQNDLNFFQSASSAYSEDPYLRIRFENSTASIDTDFFSRMSFFDPKKSDPNREQEKILRKKMMWLNSTCLKAFLNEATLDINYEGKGHDIGYDRISIEVCLHRAKEFLEKFKALSGIENCRVSFGKKDEKREKPFLRLFKLWEKRGHKNLFPDGLKLSNGLPFDGKNFFAQILKSKNFEGYLPVSYFFETATKVEIEKSNDDSHPDKFKIEINPRRHQKWIAENLPVEN